MRWWLNSCLEDLEGGMRLKRVEVGSTGGILDFGSFMMPEKGKAPSGQWVQNQRGFVDQ